MPGYLGDRESMVVHNLADMKPECNIYNVQKQNKQYFTPDTIENAQKAGFSPCKFCN